MTNPTTTAPAVAPVASAPVAAAPTVAGAVLPPGFGNAGGPPKIGGVGGGVSGGIRDEFFDKPILFKIIEVTSRTSQYEDGPVQAPTVNFIVLDPSNGTFTTVNNVTVMQKNIRRDLISAYHRGDSYVAAVATLVPTKNNQPAKVLRDLDETNSGYGVEAAKEHLLNAARSEGWF